MSDQYAKLLKEVGNAVARENGFPFLRVEYPEELSCHPGLLASSLTLGEAYIRASDEYEKLRKAAGEKSIVVDFALGPGKPVIVKTHCKENEPETTKFGIGKKPIKRTHYFEVEGYRSREASLLRNMDSLHDISDVEKTIDSKEKPKLAFGLLRELYGYHDVEELYGKRINHGTEEFVMKNSARLLGLDREETYSEMRKLAESERHAKMKELEGSLMAKLLGNLYRQTKESKIRRLHDEKLKKIAKMEYVILSKNPSFLASQGL